MLNIYLYIFHENSLLTLEIICLISTLYIIISLTSLLCFYYVVLILTIDYYTSLSCFDKLSIYILYYATDNLFSITIFI